MIHFSVGLIFLGPILGFILWSISRQAGIFDAPPSNDRDRQGSDNSVSEKRIGAADAAVDSPRDALSKARADAAVDAKAPGAVVLVVEFILLFLACAVIFPAIAHLIAVTWPSTGSTNAGLMQLVSGTIVGTVLTILVLAFRYLSQASEHASKMAHKWLGGAVVIALVVGVAAPSVGPMLDRLTGIKAVGVEATFAAATKSGRGPTLSVERERKLIAIIFAPVNSGWVIRREMSYIRNIAQVNASLPKPALGRQQFEAGNLRRLEVLNRFSDDFVAPLDRCFQDVLRRVPSRILVAGIGPLAIAADRFVTQGRIGDFIDRVEETLEALSIYSPACNATDVLGPAIRARAALALDRTNILRFAVVSPSVVPSHEYRAIHCSAAMTAVAMKLHMMADNIDRALAMFRRHDERRTKNHGDAADCSAYLAPFRANDAYQSTRRDDYELLYLAAIGSYFAEHEFRAYENYLDRTIARLVLERDELLAAIDTASQKARQGTCRTADRDLDRHCTWLGEWDARTKNLFVLGASLERALGRDTSYLTWLRAERFAAELEKRIKELVASPTATDTNGMITYAALVHTYAYYLLARELRTLGESSKNTIETALRWLGDAETKLTEGLTAMDRYNADLLTLETIRVQRQLISRNIVDARQILIDIR